MDHFIAAVTSYERVIKSDEIETELNREREREKSHLNCNDVMPPLFALSIF